MNIEVMSIGEDLGEPLSAAMKLLNAVQREFRFRPVPSGREIEGLSFQRDVYRTQEIWEFMEHYRAQAGGSHPFILGFLNRRLMSDSLGNLFGSHEGDRGLGAAPFMAMYSS
jgi:hypothetical protein